jgi:type II secretory pathway pseudopilin PulG
MVHLLFSVLAIALLAIAATAGVSYVNYGTARAQSVTQMASSGFQAWEQAYVTYRVANRSAPDSSDELAPYLAIRSVKTPSGFSWTYGSDGGGAFVCLFGSAQSDVEYEGLVRLGNPTSSVSVLPAGSISLGSACGGGGSASAGQPLAVTYRLTN